MSDRAEEEESGEGGRGRWHLQYLRFFCNPEMLARLSQTPDEEEDNGYERGRRPRLVSLSPTQRRSPPE